MKTIEELAKKHKYDIREGFRVPLSDDYVKLSDNYNSAESCPFHEIVCIDYNLYTDVFTFGCLSCGSREYWGPEKLAP